MSGGWVKVPRLTPARQRPTQTPDWSTVTSRRANTACSVWARNEVTPTGAGAGGLEAHRVRTPAAFYAQSPQTIKHRRHTRCLAPAHTHTHHGVGPISPAQMVNERYQDGVLITEPVVLPETSLEEPEAGRHDTSDMNYERGAAARRSLFSR